MLEVISLHEKGRHRGRLEMAIIGQSSGLLLCHRSPQYTDFNAKVPQKYHGTHSFYFRTKLKGEMVFSVVVV